MGLVDTETGEPALPSDPWMAAALRAVNLGERLIVVAEAARDHHDQTCGCKGEACALGKALFEAALGARLSKPKKGKR